MARMDKVVAGIKNGNVSQISEGYGVDSRTAEKMKEVAESEKITPEEKRNIIGAILK